MKHKKRWVVTALAGALAVAMVFPAYADKRKKISTVTLDIKADIQPDTDFGDETIEVETKSSKYEFSDYQIKNEGFGWTEDSVPQLNIYLHADDDYYFASMTNDQIKLKGGAELKWSTRQDSSSTLVLNVTLPSLQNGLKSIETVTLNQDGIASWNEVGTAGSYEIKVYRGGKAVGTALTSNGNSVNCRERLMKPNESYTVRVRAINKYDPEVKGEWTESAPIYVTGEMVTNYKANLDAAGVAGGSGAAGEWAQVEDGRYWFRYPDGTYPANEWKEIGGQWYFFNAEGYMQTGWITWNEKSYYCTENGNMLSDCMTPDGYWVGADGAWIQQ